MRGVHYTNAIFTCSWWMVRRTDSVYLWWQRKRGVSMSWCLVEQHKIFFLFVVVVTRVKCSWIWYAVLLFWRSSWHAAIKCNRHFFCIGCASCQHKISPLKTRSAVLVGGLYFAWLLAMCILVVFCCLGR